MAKGGFKKFVAFIGIILLLSLIVIGIFVVPKILQPPENDDDTNLNQTSGNVTIINYINNTTNTTVEDDRLGGWGALVWIFVLIIIGFIFFLMYKLLSNKKIFSKKREEACIKSAIEIMLKRGYNVLPNAEPKHSTRYYGGGNLKNPGFMFVFFDAKVNMFDNPKVVPKHLMYSCIVDAVTLEVMGVNSGLNMNDVELKERDANFGKHAPLKWAEKTEREPNIFNDFLGKSDANVNIGFNPKEVNEE